MPICRRTYDFDEIICIQHGFNILYSLGRRYEECIYTIQIVVFIEHGFYIIRDPIE